MSDSDDMPTPSLADAFTLRLEPGAAVDVGALAIGGRRTQRSVSAGMFSGRALEGQIVAASETVLTRADGVGVVEASYLIRLEDGAALRLLGVGYLTEDGPFEGLRLTLAFEADEGGPHAWLARRVFVGERSAGEDALRIAEVL
jgi:hypothetical protein